MSLEVYTGLIKDLVITNPTPTDPKSQGDDHLRGIKKTIVDDAVRVSGSPLQQMGDKATSGENHFWDASTANQLSLKRGTPDAPGAELIKALNGVLSFPNQGQSLAANGYVNLPGGLIVQWGSVAGGSNKQVPFPIAFPNAVLSGVVVCEQAISDTEAISGTFIRNSTTGFGFNPRWISGGVVGVAAQSFCWIAIGY